jgi:glycosyltransferase involved in cell wall biosynthesis
MHLFDIYAMSSHTEGLPVVLLEAMAERLAVVATSVGGVPAVLDDGGCGRLVAPADPAGLAAALIAVLGDEREREALRDAGRRRFEAKYSAAAMAKRYHEAYAALCGASAGVPA